MDKQKPLYCFSLNEVTGEISVYKITEYKECNTNSDYRHLYRYKRNGRTCDAYMRNLDTFVNWKVYSFDNSKEHAKDIITKAITEKYQEHKEQCKRYKRLSDCL